MKVYVASSWKNDLQPAVVKQLAIHGHHVYDFRNPHPDVKGFSFSEVDPNWREWDVPGLVNGLLNERSEQAYNLDFGAMQECDVCVLLLPSGRSAHIEAGWFAGANKKVIVYIPFGTELVPELMYKMAYEVVDEMNDVLEALTSIDKGGRL